MISIRIDDQITLLKDGEEIAKDRPDNVDLSVPILVNLTFNGNWAADLQAYGLAPFQADIEEAPFRRPGLYDPERDPVQRINARFITNAAITNSQSILSSVGGPDPAGNGTFGSTPDGPAPLSDNLYTFFEGIGQDISIFP